MKNERKWYAVYTRPKWEKKTAHLLSKRNIESYCPLNRIVRQWSDRRKEVYEPLFTSYVFVYATEAEHTAIKQTDGVINFVYWLNKPAVIKNTEIDTIREFLENHQNVELEQINIYVDDAVKITSGAFMQWEGSVIEVTTRKIKVLLPSFGYAMVAEVERDNVEVIPSRKYMRVSYSY